VVSRLRELRRLACDRPPLWALRSLDRPELAGQSSLEQGIEPVIPGKANRKTPIRLDKLAYGGRNVV